VQSPKIFPGNRRLPRGERGFRRACSWAGRGKFRKKTTRNRRIVLPQQFLSERGRIGPHGGHWKSGELFQRNRGVRVYRARVPEAIAFRRDTLAFGNVLNLRTLLRDKSIVPLPNVTNATPTTIIKRQVSFSCATESGEFRRGRFPSSSPSPVKISLLCFRIVDHHEGGRAKYSAQ